MNHQVVLAMFSHSEEAILAGKKLQEAGIAYKLEEAGTPGDADWEGVKLLVDEVLTEQAALVLQMHGFESRLPGRATEGIVLTEKTKTDEIVAVPPPAADLPADEIPLESSVPEDDAAFAETEPETSDSYSDIKSRMGFQWVILLIVVLAILRMIFLWFKNR